MDRAKAVAYGALTLMPIGTGLQNYAANSNIFGAIGVTLSLAGVFLLFRYLADQFYSVPKIVNAESRSKYNREKIRELEDKIREKEE